jgi:hypothetical protein
MSEAARVSLTIAVLAATLSAGALAAQDDTPSVAPLSSGDSQGNIQEEVTVSPVRRITLQDENVISSAAIKVLRHIAQARADIYRKDVDAASAELDKADTLFNIIEAAMPINQVKDRIWIARKHLEYEDSQDVLPDLIPIYSSLDELLDTMPVDKAKQHLDMAREHLHKGDKQQAARELEATGSALIYTEVDLPLSLTRRQVAEARAELTKGSMADADAALKAAEDNVLVLSVSVAEPLSTAKSSLWRAVRAYAAGTYDRAKADVREAISYLHKAARSSDEKTRSEAQKLIQQAEALEDRIDSHSSETSQELSRLWQKAQALSERAVESTSAGWARLRADSAVKKQLIDAKLHLSFAKIDRLTEHNSTTAQTELDTATACLAAAAKNADASYADTIRQIGDDAQQLSDETAATRKDLELKYGQLERRLRELIQTL